MDTPVRLLFEILPIVLGFVAIFSCARRVMTEKTSKKRLEFFGMFVCAGLLIVAQTSWTWSYLIQHSLLGTEFADVVWTSFNVGVMSVFILTSWRAQ